MECFDLVTEIKGVGAKTADCYKKLKIETVWDLLSHYPKDYDRFEAPVPIGQIREGAICAIQGSLMARALVNQVRNLKVVSCQVKDSQGSLFLTWFNQTYLVNRLHVGTHYIFRGQIIRRNGVLCMQQPAIFEREEYAKIQGKLKPVYPLTKGLTVNAIGKAVGTVLSEVEIEDFIPSQLRKKYELCTLRKAFSGIHFPKDFDELVKARRRLVFDEFFLFALAMERLKRGERHRKNVCACDSQIDVNVLSSRLSYELTNAQKKVIGELFGDMTGPYRMNRLVQGDVGSGKTVVAAHALYLAVKSGYQGVIMVPTEILASQHEQSLSELLEPFGIRVGLLTGQCKGSKKKEILRRIEEHELDIVVGTHALIEDKVVFAKLGLVITDEQHRFGVAQRERMSQKGEDPHILVMSATPIPRTLGIILYGDLDISVMDELPKNRLPIKNCVVDTNWRPNAFHFLEKQVALGHQAYVICPMVEASETMEAENVVDYTEQLRASLPFSVKVEYLHGKMKNKEKDEIMDRFLKNETQILVSTTVVEVGVNVPNATVMMIENAERFGLAQLHQLRGRVGRGNAQSYCIFMMGAASNKSKERLEVLARTNDGFEIAREDLRLRGPGDFFGIRQSGELAFALADIYQDADCLTQANEAAEMISEDEKNRLKKAYQPLWEKVEQFGGQANL